MRATPSENHQANVLFATSHHHTGIHVLLPRSYQVDRSQRDELQAPAGLPENMFLRGTWIHIKHRKHSQASIPMTCA
jgi:hypothetical protein